MESLVYLECHKASKSVQGIKLESMGVKRVSQGCLKSVSRLFLGVFRLFQESSRVSFLAVSTPNMKFQDFFRFIQKVFFFINWLLPCSPLKFLAAMSSSRSDGVTKFVGS